MKKRLLSIALALAMVLPMVPAVSLPAKAASGSASGGTTAFGLPAEEPMSDSDRAKYMTEAPFGAVTNANKDKPVTLTSMNELFLSYGWDADDKSSANWMRTYDASPSGEETGDLSKMSAADNQYRLAIKNDNQTYPAYFADSDGFNPGSGKDEYIAYLYYAGKNYSNGHGRLYLTVLDKNLTAKTGRIQVAEDHFAPSKLECYAGGGMVTVACGDFDGDGVDSIIVTSPEENLKEYTWTGSSLSGPQDVAPTNLAANSSNPHLSERLVTHNRTNVSMVAQDVDRDGFDELIVTTSGGKDSSFSSLYVLDKVDGSWKETYSAKIDAVSPGSDVGNVITAQSSDFPEIVTAGFEYNTDERFKWFITQVDVENSPKIVSGENWQPVYKQSYSGTNDNNGWTEGGHYEDDGEIHPLVVACVNYLGGANAEAIFASGSVYTFNSGEGAGTLNEVYKDSYYNSKDDGSTRAWYENYTLTNAQVEDVAVGNFDGNTEGREQIIFTTLLKQGANKNNAFSFMDTYTYTPSDEGQESEKWTSYQSEWFTYHKGKGFVTLTAFDEGTDSVIARYKDVEKTYSKPDVLAVLETFPYFEELGDDTWGESTTVYSTKSGGGSSSSNSHSLHTSLIFGTEYEIPFLQTGGGFDATVENNFTWGTETQTTREASIDFANNSGLNQVVVYRTPVLNYSYTEVNTGTVMHVQKALDPEYAMVPVDEYNEQAAAFGMTIIDESKLCEPGNPFSYPSSWATATAADMTSDKNGDVGTNWVSYQTHGNITQGFEYEEERTDTFTYELSADFQTYVEVAGCKVGGGAGYGYEYSAGTINTNGVDKAGTVQGIAPNYPDYNFQWRFAHWTVDFQGDKIPVLGYLVQNQVAPPSPPVSLNGDEILSDSFTLTWQPGRRAASEYRVYVVYDDGTYGYMGSSDRAVSTDADGNKTYELPITGLLPNKTYTFVVRGYTDGKESTDSESYIISTNADSEQRVIINTVENETVSVGRTATFETNVYLISGSAMFQWQYRKQGNNDWNDIAGNGTTLKLENVTEDMDGNQYRLRVQVNEGAERYIYYSNTAKLKIDANPTKAHVTLTGTDVTGSGEKTNPYTGQGAYTTYYDVASYTNQDVNYVYSKNVSGKDVEYPVYKVTVNGEDKYIAVVTDSTTGVKSYYIGTVDAEAHTFTPTNSDTPEKVTLKWYSTNEAEGAADADVTAHVPAGFEGVPVSKVVGGETYLEMAEWVVEEAGTSVKTYWVKQADDGKYYKLAEGGESFEPDTFSPSEEENAFTSQVYSCTAENTLVLEDENGFFALTKDAEAETYTKDENFKNAYSVPSITVGEGSINPEVDLKELATYQEPVEVTKTDTRSGDGKAVTLNAVMTYEDGGAIPNGTAASFIITNVDTGVTTTISATVGNNGEITATWTASAPGLYTIRATMPGTATISIPESNTAYYQAGGDPEVDEYRLTESGSQVPPESVVYGHGATLQLSKRVEEKWTPEGIGSYYVELVLPERDKDGKVQTEKLTELTLSTDQLNSVGTYVVRVWTSEDACTSAKEASGGLKSTKGLLASTSILVEQAEVTLRPVLGSDLPTTLSAIEISVERKDNNGKAEDFNDIKEHIEVACDLYGDDGALTSNVGRYDVSLRWKDDKEGEKTQADYRENLLKKYKVTFETATIERLQETAVVNFKASENGTLTASVMDGDTINTFNSGTAQRFTSTLQFTARPDANHYVSEWIINGTSYSMGDDLPENVTITSIMGNSEQLVIKNFGVNDLEPKDPESGMLTVEAHFSNQRAKVTFSRAGSGTVSAALKSGSTIDSGSNVNYGATIIFTAEPAEGQMIEQWTVNGVPYTHPSGELYRENTLTLADISQDSVDEKGVIDVRVEFVAEKKVTVTYSMVAENTDGEATEENKYVNFSGGSIEVTTEDGTVVSGEATFTGSFDSTQGKALTFTANITEAALNAVKEWQYRTSVDGEWSTIPGSGGQSSCKAENPDSDILQVRVIIDRAQVYNLSWNVVGQDGSVPEGVEAEITAVSNGETIVAGDHTAHIPVEFTLALSDDYYVVEWENAVQSTEDPKKATLSALTGDTVVTVTVAEKPTVTLEEEYEGGTVTVTRTYAGKVGTINDNEANAHYDLGTTVTITATPNADYYVKTIQEKSYDPANGVQTWTQDESEANITVAVVFAQKPLLTWNADVQNMGTVEVTGKRNGEDATWTFPDNATDGTNLHFDPGTSLTVTAKPENNYYVTGIQNEAVAQDKLAHGEVKKENIPAETENIEIAAKFAEKPVITWPTDVTNGKIEVKGTYCGVDKTWTASATEKTEDLHYDPNTALTVTVTPDPHYVPQMDGEDVEAVKTSTTDDVYTVTYEKDKTLNGTDLSSISFRELDKITVHFFVIGEGGYKTEEPHGAAHGTLTATVDRKGMSDNGITKPEESDNIDDYTLTLYEGGTLVLEAAGDEVGSGDTADQLPYNINFWSVDKSGDFSAHYQRDDKDIYDTTLTITYDNLVANEYTEEFYIGVNFAQAFARVSFNIKNEEQKDLGSVTAKIDPDIALENGSTVGKGTRVTFTAVINDENYEVKAWYVDGVVQENQTGDTFTCEAGTRNFTVTLELQGKLLDKFDVTAGENGSASCVPESGVRYKDTVTLTAKPEPGYDFAGWYLDGEKIEEAEAVYKTSEPANGVYTAQFTPTQGLSVAYAVKDPEGGTIEALADGQPFESEDPTLAGGQKVTLTLTVNENWRLKEEAWTNLPEGAEVSEDKLTVTIPKLTGSIETPITANVEEIPLYTVTVTQPKYTVKIEAHVDGELQDLESGSFQVREGTEVTFKIVYVDGPSYTFNHWIVDGGASENVESELKLTITGDCSVSASTTVGQMFTLTMETDTDEAAPGTGTVSAWVDGVEISNYSYTGASGTKVKVTAKPGPDSMIKEWFVGDEQVKDDDRPMLDLELPEMILDKNITVKAVFEKLETYENPKTEDGYYKVEVLSVYPDTDTDGIEEGYYRKGGDITFTLVPVNDTEDILIPYVNGFIDAGEEVTVTELEDGSGWQVEVKNVQKKIELPQLRVAMKEGISDDMVPESLKTQEVFEAMKDYLPEGITSVDQIDGSVIEETMTRVVTKAMTDTSGTTDVYDVELQTYDKERNTWVKASDQEFPDTGLTVILPYPDGTDARDTFVVAHMFTVEMKDHTPGQVEIFQGEKVKNTAMGIQFTVTSLSPIAVTWKKFSPPVIPSGGGSMAAPAPAEDTVVITPASNGTVTADNTSAKAGDTVTLTVEPDKGYTASVTVTDADGNAVEVKKGKDGTYTFVMPEKDALPVTVTATFTCDGGEYCPSKKYTDVDQKLWYHQGIDYALVRELMNGTSDTTFEPETAASRAMIVTVLYRLEGSPKAGACTFKDVAKGEWYYDAVAWAAENKIVEGYSADEFGPGDSLTREQIATILYRYAKYKEYKLTVAASLLKFKDANTIDTWAATGVRWAVEQGLLVGNGDDMLVPQKNCSRAEMAEILMRFCQWSEK